MSLVSVVMTSYNHHRYISEAIESVLRQTFDDIELIIVDDASCDGSQDIIQRHQQSDSRIRFIFHKNNEGISRTTNDGFAAANGKYIAYIQSDDTWMPEKLEKQMQVLNKNEKLIVWSEAAVIDRHGNKTGESFTQHYKAVNRRKSGDIFLELIKGNFICVQSTIFKAEYVRNFQFDTRCFYANDYKFMLDLSKKYQFHFISTPLVNYRIHGDNLILKNRDVWDKDHFFLNKYFLQNYGDDLPKKLRALFYFRMGRTLHNKNHEKIADKFLLKALLTSPSYRYCRKYLRRLFYKGRY